MVGSWRNQSSEPDGYGIHTPSRGFDRRRACVAYSVIRKRVLSHWFGGQKNCMWQLRESTTRLVRPSSPPDSRFAMRRYASVPGVRGAPGPLSKLWQSEARASGVFGGQSDKNSTRSRFTLPQLRQRTRRTSNSRYTRVSPHGKSRIWRTRRSYRPCCPFPQLPHTVFLTAEPMR